MVLLDTLVEGKKLNYLPKVLETYFSYAKFLNKEEAIQVVSAAVDLLGSD